MTPSKALAVLAASLFTLASIAVGGTFGFVIGSHYHPMFGVVLAAAAVAGELAKPLAVHAVFVALGRLDIGKAIACAALALVCIIYSLCADLGLSATMRGDAAAERANQGQAATDARARRQRALDELAGFLRV